MTNDINQYRTRSRVPRYISELKDRLFSIEKTEQRSLPAQQTTLPSRPITSTSAEKVELFMELFRGKTDVYAKRRVNSKKNTAGIENLYRLVYGEDCMTSGRNVRMGSGDTAGRKGVPREVREQTLLRLEREQQRYVDMGAAVGFDIVFKREYLYISAREMRDGWHGGMVNSPLCRLRFTGDIERWSFEIFMFSRNGYDEEQDFPFGRGSPEDCLAVAADFYLLEHGVDEAGSSRERAAEKPASFRREASVLPPLETLDEVKVPDGFPGEVVTAGRPLLDDLEAFLGFVEERTFNLAPRTQGLRRRDLIEVNGLMRVPASLHQRPVQSDAPRVQCCFAAAEALGLLQVTRALHRAEATREVRRFRAMGEHQRLWAAFEAIWQRVRWVMLRPRAYGSTNWQQAGRFWLGAALARRVAPLEFDGRLTVGAEVMEVFLFPFWRDAGLLDLVYNRRMAVNPYYDRRSTRLSRVEVTDPGRKVFGLLSEISPGYEHLCRTEDPADDEWQGRFFISQVEGAGTFLDFDPAMER